MKNDAPAAVPQFLTSAEAARIVKIAPGVFSKWLRKGKGPAHIRIGNRIRIRHTDFDAWLKSHETART